MTTDPNNAIGAADALTPPGPSEFDTETMIDAMINHRTLPDDVIAQREAGYYSDDAEIVRQLKRDLPEEHNEIDRQNARTRMFYVDPLTKPEPSPLYAAAGATPFETIEVNESNVGVALAPLITGEFINHTLRNVRAPFEAKMKRGKAFKAARARLVKRADEAVCEFRGAYLSELTDEQALRISLGITGLVGDNVHGFRYLDVSEE